MGIAKPLTPQPPAPKADDKAVDAWIKKAPSGLETGEPVKERKLIIKGNKVQFSHAMTKDELDAIEGFAKSIGMSRTAAINLACTQLIRLGIVMTGKEPA